MARPLLIAPSILSADFGRLAEEAAAAIAAGADYLHVDVMDGHFVPNLTIGPAVVRAVRAASSVPLDVHLMIEDPDRYLEAFAAAGADILCVHVEVCRHLNRTVNAIRALGKTPAVALNPATPLCTLDHVLGDVAMVLLMTVNPGFGGQAFIPSVLPKIRALRSRIEEAGLEVDLEVDGGIKVDNVAQAAAAGANVIVSGSGVFRTADYADTIGRMRRAAGVASGRIV